MNYGLQYLGTLENLNVMGIYEQDKGTRELNEWRRRSKILQRVKTGKNQSVKKRQREVATEKYKTVQKGVRVEGKEMERDRAKNGEGAGGQQGRCGEGDSVEIKISSYRLGTEKHLQTGLLKKSLYLNAGSHNRQAFVGAKGWLGGF